MTHSTRCKPTLLTLSLTLLLATLTFVGQAFAQSDSDEETPQKANHNAKDVLTGNTAEKKLYFLRKIRFIDDATVSFTDSTTSDLAFEMDANQPLPFFLDEDGLKALEPGAGSQDWIGEELRRRQSDIPPTISLNDAIRNLVRTFKKKPKRLEDRNLPIPTDTEIDILKILWVEKKATAGEIYVQLDTSQVIFAEELRAILARMVDRGFLDRKKISPSNEFSLFGIAQIELSSKNRKNKQYLYWPIVTKEKLFTYMDAKRFLALAAQNEQDYDLQSNNYTANYQKLLERKLYRLFEQ
ncbi:MAG: hypothetical protein ACE5IY_13410 [bacterium]